MREILFRGKRIDNGEWAEGCLFYDPDLERTDITQFKYYNGENGLERDCDVHFVKPETVGQYTGLKDKNGKRIFEGDIVCLDDTTNELWAFDFGNCGGVQNVRHEVGYMGFYLRPLSEAAIRVRDYGQRDDPIYYLNALRLLIIGNIHDNPELLGGAK